jgi:hypothetical protein
MKYIFDRIKQLARQRLLTRLKHLRGQHDQRDHAWNRGMGRGGAGVELGPDQMGPLPTMQMYRQQRLALMDQHRQGEITRDEMRQQIRDLRGMVDSPSVVLGSNSESTYSATVAENIRKFQEQRDAMRLPDNFDVTPYIDKMSYAGDGISNVQRGGINGETYFYRRLPYYGRDGYKYTDTWSSLRGPLRAIAADDIASALGLPLAPVSSLTNERFVITPAMTFVNEPVFDVFNKYKNDFFNAQTKEEEEKAQDKYIRFQEPLAIMDLIIGQNDGHQTNINIIKNPNRDLYDSEEILTSVDYDLSGRNYHKSIAIVEWARALALDPTKTDRRILTPEMREILTQFSQNVQWSEFIPERAQQEYLARVQAILYMDATMTVGDLSPHSMAITGTLDDDPYFMGNEISTSIKNKFERMPQFSSPDLVFNLFIMDLQSEIKKAEEVIFQQMRDLERRKPSGFTTQMKELKQRMLSVRDELFQSMFNISQDIDDGDRAYLMNRIKKEKDELNMYMQQWSSY